MNESQKYLDEMMRFYSLNKNASVNTETDSEESTGGVQETEEPDLTAAASENEPREYDNNEDASEAPNIADKSENDGMELRNDTAGIETNESAQDSSENTVSFESRFPIPVIPDFIRNQEPEPDAGKSETYVPPDRSEAPDAAPAEEKNIPYTDYGFLKVEVRTGENGLPVPEAAVTVVEKNGVRDEIIFTGVTDASGIIDKIKLSAPGNSKGNSPESFQNYSVYTVSVFFKDFYRGVSSDVPIFAGITSIQRFNLIPMPFGYNDGGQSIVNENTEPNI